MFRFGAGALKAASEMPIQLARRGLRVDLAHARAPSLGENRTTSMGITVRTATVDKRQVSARRDA
jgi:hypothetical protein